MFRGTRMEQGEGSDADGAEGLTAAVRQTRMNSHFVPLCIVPSYAQFEVSGVHQSLCKWPVQGALVFT